MVIWTHGDLGGMGAGVAVNVRPAACQDRDALLAMMAALSAFEARLEPDRTGELAPNAAYLDSVSEAIARKGGVILIAEVAGTLAGYAAAVVQEDAPYIIAHLRRHAYITDMYVNADHRRHGVGRALAGEITAWARAQGIHRIAVGALAANPVAREAYVQYGFRPYAIEYIMDLEPTVGG